MTATSPVKAARKPPKNPSTKTIANSAKAATQLNVQETIDSAASDARASNAHSIDVAAADNIENVASVPDEDLETRIARLFLEDYVATALLRQGRALPFDELEAASGVANFAPNAKALRQALNASRRVEARPAEWDLKLRVQAAQKPRAERSRQPLEGTLEELLKAVGKPLPLPVIVREVAALRGVLPEAVRDGATHIVRTTRSIYEVSTGAWIHTSFLLDSELPSQSLIIRENRLEENIDFRELRDFDFSIAASDAPLSERATEILNQAARPLPQAVLGYFLWKQDEARGQAANFDARALAQTLADRAQFYPFAGGLVSTQKQKAIWQNLAQSWLESQIPAEPTIAELLNETVPAHELIAPTKETLATLTEQASADAGPISVLSAISDVLHLTRDDAQFLPALQGLNAALTRDAAWMAAGVGRFLLRSSLPRDVGTIPDILNPVTVESKARGEAIDFEMSDEGLEGDCLEFVHSPQWEEIGEEVEARLARRDMSTSTYAADQSVRSVLIYPHHLAGTVKLRRIDEAFFGLEDAVSHLSIEARDEEGSARLDAWADRNTGLIYNLVDWYSPRTPSSGAVLEFSRDESGQIVLRLGAPDTQTHLDDDRVEQLELMLETVESAPLFEILQALLKQHPQGAALATLWAETNVLRRTTKRLMCSVLSAYNCFSFKNYGEKGSRWHFDASKLDQGFKRNKSKFVRR